MPNFNFNACTTQLEVKNLMKRCAFLLHPDHNPGKDPLLFINMYTEYERAKRRVASRQPQVPTDTIQTPKRQEKGKPSKHQSNEEDVPWTPWNLPSLGDILKFLDNESIRQASTIRKLNKQSQLNEEKAEQNRRFTYHSNHVETELERMQEHRKGLTNLELLDELAARKGQRDRRLNQVDYQVLCMYIQVW